MSKASLVKFTTWCVDKKTRKEISVDPARVVTTEHYSDAFKAGWGEEFPAATRIVLRDNKATFLVQGDHADVVDRLNGKTGVPQVTDPATAGATTAEPQGDPASGQPPQPLGQQPAGLQGSPAVISGPQGDPASRSPAAAPRNAAGGAE